MSILTLAFWRAAAERAAKTAAQVAILKTGALASDGGFDALAADWPTILSWTVGGVILSILFSVASDAATGTGPSLTNAEVIPDTEAEAAYQATFDDEAETIGDSKSAATYHPRHDAGPTNGDPWLP